MQSDKVMAPGPNLRARMAALLTLSISRSLQIVAVGLVLIVVSLVIGRTLELRRVIIHTTTSQVARLDMVFAEQTGRAIETIDFLMRSVAAEAARSGGVTSDGIARRIMGVQQLLEISLTDASGRVLVAAHTAPGAMLPAAGLRLIAKATGGGVTGLQISEPMRDAQGRWTALMLRPVTIGGAAHFVVGFINLAYFQDFYRAVDLPENGAILLHLRDGTVLARYPADDRVVGTSYAHLPPFRDILSHETAGTVEMTSPIDGSVRILAIRALKAFPLAVNVSVDEDVVLTTWRRQAITLAVSVVAAGGLVAALLFLLARRTRQAEQLLGSTSAAYAAAAQANHDLLLQIAERERAEAALRQAQRVEAVGQLTGGVAHDFNNLLTVILGNVDLLQASPGASRFAARLTTIRAAAERGANLTSQMLAFARRQPLMPRAVDLNALIQGMTPLLQSAVGTHVRIELRLEAEDGTATVDPTQVELVILNLAINARDAMPEGGTLTLGTALSELPYDDRPDAPPPGAYLCITVRDTGTGMPPEVLARVFEPFFTTKGPNGGSGLGLSQAYGVARQSGGTLTLSSAVGQGTTVSLYLPRAEARAEPPPSQAAPSQPAETEHRATLLVVDDDTDVLATTTMLLRRRGYAVLDAGNAQDALVLLKERPAIDLLLTDMVMPDVNGPELARRARTLRPGLPVVFFSGYADPEALAGSGSTIRLVRKPFRPGDLADMIESALKEAAPLEGGLTAG